MHLMQQAMEHGLSDQQANNVSTWHWMAQLPLLLCKAMTPRILCPANSHQ